MAIKYPHVVLTEHDVSLLEDDPLQLLQSLRDAGVPKEIRSDLYEEAQVAGVRSLFTVVPE